MDDVVKHSQSIILESILKGEPLDGIKKSCAQMPENDSFRKTCEIAIELREGKPKDALELAKNWINSHGYSSEINVLIECAKNQIEIDDLLIKHNLEPPLPTFLSAGKTVSPIPDVNLFDDSIPRNGVSGTMPRLCMNSETRQKFKKEFETKRGEFSKAELYEFANSHSLTFCSVQQYFRHLKYHPRKKLREQERREEKKLNKPPNVGNVIQFISGSYQVSYE